MGDSIMGQNYGPTGKSAAGCLNWLQALLGQPWSMTAADNFAVAGTLSSVVRAVQLPNVIASSAIVPIQRAFISSGTNDTNAGRPLADIKSDLSAIIDTLLNAGIIPVHIGILPRGNDGAVTAAKLQNMQLNEWLENYAYTQGGLEFIDCSLAIANNATAFGNALVALTDGTILHPNDAGAYYIGNTLASYYRAKGVAPAIRFAASQADIFNATNNPSGVVFDNPNPLLQGGTTAPTNMTTSGGVWAMGTRTLPNGQTKPQAVCTLAANTTHFLYADALATGRWDTENIREGDLVYGVCELELVNVTSLQGCELTLVESDGVTQTSSGDLVATAGSIGATGSSVTLFTQTPLHRIRPYGGSGSASVFLRQRISTGVGEVGTVRIKGFEMRKYIAP